MLYALLPGRRCDRPPSGEGGTLSCLPGQINCDLETLLGSSGELRLFFPDCLSMAAPLLLFRLKRRGFSRCSVQASRGGLLLQGWR